MKTLLRALGVSTVLALVIFAVTIYYTSPQAAPPSASDPIGGTPESLAQLFQKECIDQIDLPWIMAETRRRKWWICQGQGDGSDCLDRAAGMIEWDVKAPPNSRIHVVLLNERLTADQPAGNHQCSIHTSEELGPALLQSLRLLKIHGRALAGSVAAISNDDIGDDLAQNWKPIGLGESAPTITIVHAIPYERYMRLKPNLDKSLQPFERVQRSLPWSVFYNPPQP